MRPAPEQASNVRVGALRDLHGRRAGVVAMAVDDLTERLRRTIADAVPPEEWQKPYPTWHDLMGEAADEIERLHAEVERLRKELILRLGHS